MADDNAPLFVEIDYTGRASGVVFDTTRKEDAAPGAQGPFEPAVVKLGSGQLIPGLDAFLKDKQPGTYAVALDAEHAFGRKQADRIKLLPLSSFGKDGKRLETGMPVTVGELHGVVKSIGGGRVVVDFNHPLAGQAVEYTVQLHGFVDDPVKRVQSIVKAFFGVALPVEARDGKTILKLPKGFPADGLVKELEKHTGVTVTVEDIEVAAGQHVHEDGTVHDDAAHEH